MHRTGGVSIFYVCACVCVFVSICLFLCPLCLSLCVISNQSSGKNHVICVNLQ